MPSLKVNPWTLGLRNLASKTRNSNLRGYIELARVRTSIGQRSFTFCGPIVRKSILCSAWQHMQSPFSNTHDKTSVPAVVASSDFGATYKCQLLLYGRAQHISIYRTVYGVDHQCDKQTDKILIAVACVWVRRRALKS